MAFYVWLTPEQDGWFYSYNQTAEAYMLSIFREQNGEVKLFVNYKQLDGRVASGLSKSLDSMITQLANKRLSKPDSSSWLMAMA